MQTTILLYFMLLILLKNTHEFFKNLREQLKFLKKLSKKDILNLSFSDELELFEIIVSSQKSKFTNYWYKKILIKQFNTWLYKIESRPKFLSNLNIAIEKIFLLEQNENFKQEILRNTLKYQGKILQEVKRFNKLNKAHVLEKFFNFFNGKCEFFAFSNDLNLLAYKRAGGLALWTKKIVLLDILDDIQKENIRKFVA